ncbi:chaperone protein dnaJ 49 [Diospyros lotus]|uniref:chaperone protein dnaJ 49 n=1 Tax=Diospyros lotus TaxID=55363 RepID=UPI00224DB8E4|nr:chaperone protein dnaJ 49 [Diospyros lotus]
MMNSNKDEALRCIAIAKEAISSGKRQCAVKFIAIARRLDPNLGVDDLLAAADNPESAFFSDYNDKKDVGSDENDADSARIIYSEEQVQLIKKIQRCRDYYEILGLEKSCSMEDMRRAYRKMSLKVHPDKNKTPGSEDAFKKVSKAFKCLSDDDSRRQYDRTGWVEEFEHSQQYNVSRRRRRRRTTEPDLFDDDLDADEMFKAFFGQSDMFQASRVYRTRTRTRTRAGNQQWDDFGRVGLNLMLLLQLLPILLILLLAYLPFSEPDYSLQKNYFYQFPKITEKHGVDFFVKSPEFDLNFPLGSPSRANIENSVIRDYGRYCHIELQRRRWRSNLPTPHCDKLQSFGVA